MEINGELIRRVWEKASVIRGQNPEVYRMDVNGKWIKMKEFNNTDSEYGWTIYSVDGSDIAMHNLQELIPVHTYNNSVPLVGFVNNTAGLFQNPLCPRRIVNPAGAEACKVRHRLVRRPPVKARMWPAAIVEGQIPADRGAGLANSVVGLQVDLPVLDRPP